MKFSSGYDEEKEKYVINIETDDYETFLRAKKGMIYGIEQALAGELEKLENEDA
ncbi:MAG: hypothetical protein IJ306_02535 [Oscillospiraceae bacterium]|nr:hypothetical protein [Oscillospiraceae bacterium]